MTAKDDLHAVRARALRRERRRGTEDLRVRTRVRAECVREHLGAPRHRIGALRLGLQQHEPPERWIAEALASRELGLRERHVIVRSGGADRVVIREVRLHDALPTRRAAPRSPEHLHEQFEGALGRCEVGKVEHGVGVHDAHERNAGKVEPFGDHLRADDHLRAATAHFLEERRMRALGTHRVAVESHQRRAGDSSAHIVLDALRTHAEMPDARAPALRAHRRRCGATAAAMADQRAVDVIGEGDLARGARRDVAAVAAEHDRREPAAVEVEDGLLAARDCAPQRDGERARERAAIAGAQLETKVDDRRWRHHEVADALRQREQTQGAGRGGVIRDDARRRAAQDDDATGKAPERESGVDGVVARGRLLFVRRLLLLVDDDKPRMFERREERGPRADDDIGHAVEDASPFVEPLARAQRRVKERDAIAETRDEARHDLGGEGDLRHKHDDAEPASQRFRRGAQVDLGLPARGHTVEQERVAATEPRDDRVESGSLAGGRGGVAHRVVLRERELARHAPDRARAFGGKTASRERACGDRGAAGVCELRARARAER